MTRSLKTFLSGAVGGALVISFGGLVAKILGAIYRIPLTNILKAEGIGVYQTAFPVYTILLTFSSTGVPTALSKLISSGEDENAVLNRALSVFIPAGIAGTLLMAALAVPVSALQGNPDAALSYVCLSPSVALVSAISCYRGFFQGKRNMFPTATSQILEQAVKLAAGLSLCFFLATSPSVGGALACLAVSISELAAFIYLRIKYEREKSRDKNKIKYSVKRLIAIVFPVTLSAVIIPLSRVFDSFAIINILSGYTDDATALYGLYTGGVESVIGVPIAICYGLAVSSLPNLAKSSAENESSESGSLALKAISLTLAGGAILGGAVSLLARPISQFVFRGLTLTERDIVASLLSYSFPCVILLSLHQTCASVLIANGKTYAPCSFAAIGVIFKAIIEISLLRIPEINIFATLISDFACYLIAVFFDLVYIISIYKKLRSKNDEDNFDRRGRETRGFERKGVRSGKERG